MHAMRRGGNTRTPLHTSAQGLLLRHNVSQGPFRFKILTVFFLLRSMMYWRSKFLIAECIEQAFEEEIF